jgi:hypothetical protein
MQLKARLASEGLVVRWLNAVLAVPFAHVALKGRDVKNVAVVNVRTLVTYLRGRSDELDRQQIEGYVAALDRIAEARPSPNEALPESILSRGAMSRPAA